MKRTFILCDAMNLFFRSVHVVHPTMGVDSMIGMAFHIILNSMKKSWNTFNADHIVFCLEGKSFRKGISPEYKLNRTIARLAKTEKQQETDAIMIQAFDDMCTFFSEKTNITTLQCPIAEADDMIALWIAQHPSDDHIIISSDKDYYQLIAPNVKIYNGVENYMVTDTGFYDDNGKIIIDKQTKLPKPAVDPNYFLFLKCIRGDKSDNIFSAYPGVRENGTKKIIGIREAYNDKSSKGYNWNNFMLQKWVDTEGKEHYVKDKYDLNSRLVDLKGQPEHVKEQCFTIINEAVNKSPVDNIGFSFMKFCGRWDLQKISKYVDQYTTMLNAKYKLLN